MIVIPATQQIWMDAMHEGLFDIFVESGAAVSTPTCGPCLGGHMGILAKGERCVRDHEPQFRRAHGGYPVEGVSGQRGRCRGVRGAR